VLSAVRRDSFKAHFVVPADGATAGSVNPQLYNLDEDPSEKFDLAAKRPEVLMELRALADEHAKTVVTVKNQIATRPQSKGSRP
jgi:arylsulfatase A-like enzyme